jgi:hypothetical protein
MTMPDEDDEDQVPGHLGPDELDLEAPPEDAVEQATPVDPDLEEPAPRIDLEVPEWDAIEQARVVPIDEDDYL